jgi:hypothetical protein
MRGGNEKPDLRAGDIDRREQQDRRHIGSAREDTVAGRRAAYPTCATASISTRAFFGNPAA